MNGSGKDNASIVLVDRLSGHAERLLHFGEDLVYFSNVLVEQFLELAEEPEFD